MNQKPMVKGGSFLIEDVIPDGVFVPEEFTEEHRMIAKTAHDFVENEVRPRDARIEEKEPGLSEQLLRQAGELGLLMVDIPEEYGGMGLDRVTSALVTEKFGAAGSFSVTFGAHTGIGTLPIVYFGTEEQKQKYLPDLGTGERIGAYALTEAGSGSDALGAKAYAILTPDGKHYELNGVKQFITNSGIAHLITVFAKVDKEQFTAFLVQRDFPGVSTGAEEKKMGVRGSSTRQLILENARVPVENVLGEVGRGHVIAFNVLNVGRFKLGAGTVGGVKGALSLSARYAKERVQFGKPIASYGAIQEKLGEMAVRLYALESAVYRTAGLIDDAVAHIQPGDPEKQRRMMDALREYAVECSIIKILGSEVLDYAVDEAVQIHGGYGFIQDYPVERYYRDSRINRIWEGTSEINRMLILSTLMRRTMKGELPLLGAAQKAIEEVMTPSASLAEDGGERLARERRLLAQAKKAALFCAGSAAQKYMAALEEQQEILLRVASQVVDLYAMESALLRAEKAARGDGGRGGELHTLLTQIYCNDALARIELLGQEILASFLEGDMLRTQLLALRKLCRHSPLNTIRLRREIAQAVLEAAGFPL